MFEFMLMSDSKISHLGLITIKNSLTMNLVKKYITYQSQFAWSTLLAMLTLNAVLYQH